MTTLSDRLASRLSDRRLDRARRDVGVRRRPSQVPRQVSPQADRAERAATCREPGGRGSAEPGSWRDRATALREQAAIADRASGLRERAAVADRAAALRDRAAVGDRAAALRDRVDLEALRERIDLERVARWRREAGPEAPDEADGAQPRALDDDATAPVTVEALVTASLPEIAVSATAATSGLPEGSRVVDLDGPVHYVVREPAGPVDGPPIVCVHGLGGSHANWHDLGPLLARSRRVYALDLAGHGRTPRVGRSAAVRANRRLLDRFLAEVVGGPAVLLGNSMGGTIAVLEAAAHPERVADLVLIGPAAPRVRAELPDLVVARQAALFAVPGVAERVLTRRRERLGAEGWVREQMSLTTADITRVSEQMRAVAVELVASRAAGPDAEAAFLEAARSLVALLARGGVYRQKVAAVPHAALVLHGELDRLVPLSCSQALVEQRPDWRLEVLDGVGHVPQIEVPARTAELVLAWLDRSRPVAVEQSVPTRLSELLPRPTPAPGGAA